MKKIIAFTLAEVLITLGIIGVVAAMTIPTLMQNMGNNQFEAGFRKVLSTFSNAINLIKIDNGGTLISTYSSTDNALDGICNIMKCTKKCYTSDDRTQCFHNGTDWYTLDGRQGWQDYSTLTNNASAILIDGTTFDISWKPSCNGNNGTLTTICGNLAVDVNGFKKPNKMGRDIFELFIEQNKVIPNGVMSTSADYATNPLLCDPSSSSQTYNGCNCGGRILSEGGLKY